MEQYTPMMQQYLEVKKNYQDALVFYRLGDFYEMFFEDAKIASCELDLVLTGRNAGVKDRVPMCGVPFHAVTGYIQRLVQKGYKVAIVEQMEDPALAKGLVKRDVIKVVTPGTVIDELFDERSSIYLAAVVDYQYGFALSICEMSTGETTVTHIPRNILHLQQTLLKNNIREIVVKEGFDEKFIRGVRDLSAVAISYCATLYAKASAEVDEAAGGANADHAVPVKVLPHQRALRRRSYYGALELSVPAFPGSACRRACCRKLRSDQAVRLCAAHVRADRPHGARAVPGLAGDGRGGRERGERGAS